MRPKDNYNEFFYSKSSLKPKQPNGNDKIVRFLTITKAIHFFSSKKLHFQRLDKFQDQYEGLWTEADDSSWNKYKGFDVSKFSSGFRSTIGISCWSKGSNKNGYSKMWSQYVPDNQGVAIVSNVGNLCRGTKNGLDAIGADFAKFVIAEVDYVDRSKHSNLANLEETDFLPNVTIPCYQKDLAYSFEEEVRILVFALAKDKTAMQIEETGFDVPIETLSFLDEILLPPNLSNWEKDVFHSLLGAYGVESKIKP